MDQTWLIIFAVSMLAGVIVLGGLFALAYVLLARLIVRQPITWNSALLAGVLGMGAYLIVVGALVYAVRALAIPGSISLVGILIFAIAFAMALVSKLVMRTKAGDRITFPQAFMLQVLPNALFFLYWYSTRPQP